MTFANGGGTDDQWESNAEVSTAALIPPGSILSALRVRSWATALRLGWKCKMMPHTGGLLLFLVITFAITLGLDGVVLVMGLEWTRSGPPSLARHLHTVVTWSPMIAALMVAPIIAGRRGMRELWSGLTHWRLSPALYVVALGSIGAVYGAGALAYTASGNVLPTNWLHLPQPFAPMLIAQVLLVALPEELGWRGFALPRLQAKFGSLGASLVLGALHAFWHFPLFLIAGTLQHGESFPRFMLIVIAWSVLMSVLYNRSGGSVLTAVLFHAALNMWASALVLPEAAWELAYLFYIPAVLLSVCFLPRPLFKMFSTTRKHA